jgi:signal transduction histidine kinase
MNPLGRLSSPLAALAKRASPRQRTIRLRLTAVYGGLFLACGAALLAVTYVLVSRSAGADCFRQPLRRGGRTVGTEQVCGSPAPARGGSPLAGLHALAASYHHAEMRQLLAYSGIALGIIALLAIGLGWVVAGRVLRPLQAITEAARGISATSLDRRLALAGPDDELKRLADTFDNLLGRLSSAFDGQRRFVSHASHELRTPLTVSRALLQATLTDPGATIESFRSTIREAIEIADQQEQLIEALLLLARSDRGLDHREPVDLAAITTEALSARQPEIDRRGLRLAAATAPAITSGDPRLTARLVANLIDNALRHNIPGGQVQVAVGSPARRPYVTVANTGPHITTDDLHRLFQPFERLSPDPAAPGDGLGLGLSIVQAIANAHDAALSATPKPGGGLEITVSFPHQAAAHNGRRHSPLPRRSLTGTWLSVPGQGRGG